jgi:hypothetical protein
MSLRAALVDAIIAESSINTLISGRCFDYFYEFEDLLNQKANSNKFPAITIVTDGDENELNQDGHDNINQASFSITCYQQIHLAKMRSRSATVRAAQKTLLRQVDTLSAAVKAYLNGLKGSTISGLYIRKSHIDSISDSTFETEGNREIITREISFTALYS